MLESIATLKMNNKQLSPLKSIKKYCKEECCVGDTKSWKECSRTTCFLYRYRLGIGNKTLNQKHSSVAIDSTKNEPLEAQERL